MTDVIHLCWTYPSCYLSGYLVECPERLFVVSEVVWCEVATFSARNFDRRTGPGVVG